MPQNPFGVCQAPVSYSGENPVNTVSPHNFSLTLILSVLFENHALNLITAQFLYVVILNYCLSINFGLLIFLNLVVLWLQYM